MYSDLHGGVTMQSGQGFDESSLPVALSEMDNRSVLDENRFSEIQSKMSGQREMVSESQKETQSEGASWMLRNYDQVLRDKSSIISEYGQNGEKLVEMAHLTKKIAEDYGYSKEQMAGFGVGANVGLGIGSGKGGSGGKSKDSGGGAFGMVKGLFSGGASVNADGKASSTDKQGLTEGLNVTTGNNNDKVFDAMNSYTKQKNLKEGGGNESSDSKTFNQTYDEYKQKQQTLEVMENESKQLQKSIAVSKSSAFQVVKNNQQDFFNYFARHGDWTSSMDNKKFGYKDALSHIQKRDKVFEDVVGMYELHKEGQAAKRAGTLQYQQEKYSQNSDYSSNIKQNIDATEVTNKTSSATPPKEYTEKPTLNDSDKNMNKVIDQNISNNKKKIGEGATNTKNTKSNLESKVDAADDSVIGKYARNEGVVGTPNQFVKNRKDEDGDDK
jgi:hypothetical protein